MAVIVPGLKKRDTYYLIDPGRTESNCVPSNEVEARVVLITSPSSANWGGSNFEKKRDILNGEFIYDSLWTLDELLAARKEIPLQDSSILSSETVTARYREVGGVPRHVFSDTEDKYAKIVLQQDADVDTMTTKQIESIAFRGVSSIDASDTMRPKSSIVGYKVDNDGRRKTVVVSDLVAEKMYYTAMKELWNTMVQRGVGGRLLLEPYCRRLLSEEQERRFLSRSCVGPKENRTKYEQVFNITLGGCTQIQMVVDIVEASKKKEMVLF